MQIKQSATQSPQVRHMVCTIKQRTTLLAESKDLRMLTAAADAHGKVENAELGPDLQSFQHASRKSYLAELACLWAECFQQHDTAVHCFSRLQISGIHDGFWVHLLVPSARIQSPGKGFKNNVNSLYHVYADMSAYLA